MSCPTLRFLRGLTVADRLRRRAWAVEDLDCAFAADLRAGAAAIERAAELELQLLDRAEREAPQLDLTGGEVVPFRAGSGELATSESSGVDRDVGTRDLPVGVAVAEVARG